MSTPPTSITYRYQLPPTPTAADPVLETLAAPYLHKLEHSEYIIVPARGTTCIGYHSRQGTLTIPPLNKIYPLLALQNNPFTLIGDTEIALIVSSKIEPGPGLHPIAALTNIYREPTSIQDVDFTAIAATMAKATRRGIDLVTSIINTELLLHTFDPSNQKTLEATLQAYLYKLTHLGTELRLRTTYTTRYLDLVQLAQPAQNILNEIITRRNPWNTLQSITQNREFAKAITGKYYARWTNREPPTGSIDSVAQELRTHLEETAASIKTRPNIVYVVTGQTSLADLYLIAQIPIAKQVHLLITPETLPIITYIAHRLNANLTNNTLQLNIGRTQLQAKIYLASHTDHHITRKIITKIPDHTLLNKKIYEL